MGNEGNRINGPTYNGYVRRKNVTLLIKAAAQAKQVTTYSSNTRHQRRLMEAVLTGFPGILIFWMGNEEKRIDVLLATPTTQHFHESGTENGGLRAAQNPLK